MLEVRRPSRRRRARALWRHVRSMSSRSATSGSVGPAPGFALGQALSTMLNNLERPTCSSATAFLLRLTDGVQLNPRSRPIRDTRQNRGEKPTAFACRSSWTLHRGQGMNTPSVTSRSPSLSMRRLASRIPGGGAAQSQAAFTHGADLERVVSTSPPHRSLCGAARQGTDGVINTYGLERSGRATASTVSILSGSTRPPGHGRGRRAGEGVSGRQR